MKFTLIRISLLLYFGCNFLFSNGQQRGIDSLYINPLQPNSNDTIVTICWFGSSTTPCGLDSFSVNIIDSTITIDAYYVVGFGQAICFSYDTIQLGQLLPKKYKLKYNAIDNYTPFASVSDSIYFTVNQVIGLPEGNNPVESISVFPNPSKEAINLKVQLDRAVFSSIKITDTQGRIVHMEQLQLLKGESLHTIATKAFPSGIYTLSLWSEGKLLEEEKIIVQQ